MAMNVYSYLLVWRSQVSRHCVVVMVVSEYYKDKHKYMENGKIWPPRLTHWLIVPIICLVYYIMDVYSYAKLHEGHFRCFISL